MAESTVSRKQRKHEENQIEKERDFLFVHLIESVHWRFPFFLSPVPLYELPSIGQHQHRNAIDQFYGEDKMLCAISLTSLLSNTDSWIRTL
jgi:hypothetical protein